MVLPDGHAALVHDNEKGVENRKLPQVRGVRRGHFVFLLAGGFLIIAIIGLLTGWAIVQGKADARRTAKVDTANLSRTLADTFNSQVHQIDLGLLSILDEIERSQSPGKRDDETILAAVIRQDSRHPNLTGFRIFGPDGKLRHGVRNVANRNATVSEREDFKLLRETPDAGLMVAPPIFGLTTQQWSVAVSRRITNPDGSFGGMVVCAIPAATLMQSYSTLDLGPGGTVALFHASFRIAARFPEVAGSNNPIGAVMSDKLRAIIAAGGTAQHYTYSSVVDGISRIAHVRQIEGQPYSILVGQAADYYLADWRRHSLYLLLFAGAMVVLVLAGMVTVHRRLSDRRQATAALMDEITLRREREHQLMFYRNLIEYSSDPIYVISPAQGFRLIFVNDATCRHYGADRETLLQRRIPDWDPNFTDQASLDTLWRQIKEKGSLEIQTTQRLASGRLTPVKVSANYLIHDGEELIAGYFDDISARIAAETAMREKTDQLIQSNADLERFAYVASHDLQTPLRNIVGYAQLLERRYKNQIDADADDFIGFIVDSSKHMTQLISDLLEYSRIASQPRPLQPVPAETSVTQALGNLRLEVDRVGAEITVAPLPRVLAEHTLLVSLFQNLLGNALKYCLPGRSLKLSVTADRISPELWRFAVRDNGIGIEAVYLEKIFEIFQRLHPSTEKEGTGIGLTLCRRILLRLGGTIWAESVPGESTTFFFTLQDAAAVPQP